MARMREIRERKKKEEEEAKLGVSKPSSETMDDKPNEKPSSPSSKLGKVIITNSGFGSMV